MAEKMREGKVRCSFCQKTEDQVRKLIAGPDGKVFISKALLSQKGGNEQMRRRLAEINRTRIDFSKLRVRPNQNFLSERFQTYRSFQ